MATPKTALGILKLGASTHQNAAECCISESQNFLQRAKDAGRSKNDEERRHCEAMARLSDLETTLHTFGLTVVGAAMVNAGISLTQMMDEEVDGGG